MRSFTLTNLPVRRSPQDYERARRALAEHAAGRPDIVALFEYGTVRLPGVSDLDPIVVLADRPDFGIAQYLDPRLLPREVASVMDGATLMVMAESGFPEITRWDDVRLRRLSGKPLKPLRVRGRALHYTEGCRLVDWLPWHAARLTRLLLKGEIPVRQTLGQLWSLTYSLRRLERLFGVSRPSWKAAIDGITLARERWFLETKAHLRRLPDLVFLAQQAAYEALAALGRPETMAGPGWYGPNRGLEGRLEVPGGIELHFTSRRDLLSGQAALRDSNGEKVIVHLPGIFLRHFAVYGMSEGVIGRKIREALHPGVQAPSPAVDGLVEVLEGRMAACERWACFLRANRFRSGLFKFAWFYEPPPSQSGAPAHPVPLKDAGKKGKMFSL